jgi:multicomponent Na+:H+ antiporter subunit D
VFILCAVLVGAAVLRVALGVFWGLGDPPGEDPRMAAEANEETGETESDRQRTPLTMLIPTAALALLGLGAGLVALLPRAANAIEAAAVRFQDQPAYIRSVLYGARVAHPAALYPAAPADVTVSSVVTSLVAVLGAILLALAALYWRRLPVLRRGYEPGAGLEGVSQGFQSGVVNDYVTWLVAGLACIGGVLALIMH